MGFRSSAAPAQAAQMLLLASVEGAEPEVAAAALREGAHGVIATVGPATKAGALKDLSTAAAAGLWGGALEAGGKEEVVRLQQAGAHFALFRSAAVAGDVLEVDEIDTVLEVDQAWPDMLLRSVQQLPVAAALYRIQATDGLSIQQLLQCRRVAALVGVPVLAAIPPGLGVGSLTLLRDAGTDGVVVAAASVPEFHAAIRDLPPRKKIHERMAPVLPAGGRAPVYDEDEEDDDEPVH